MPVLTLWVCPVCGTQSAPAAAPPYNWITVGGQAPTVGPSINEVFDTWQCVSTYAQGQTVAPTTP